MLGEWAPDFVSQGILADLTSPLKSWSDLRQAAIQLTQGLRGDFLANGCGMAWCSASTAVRGPQEFAVLLWSAGGDAFLLSWSDFPFANTFTSSVDTRTLTVEVTHLIGNWGQQWGDLTAGAIATIPAQQLAKRDFLHQIVH